MVARVSLCRKRWTVEPPRRGHAAPAETRGTRTMIEPGKKKGTIRVCYRADNHEKDVRLAGDFNNWAPIKMSRQRTGIFVSSLTVPPGKYQYKFVVDGQWVVDKENPQTLANPFGTANSVAVVE